ncbi:MAG: histidine triad nucleotide-binding protein [bacterium]|nr:histidine triad nucleotide-binding protein [bacterium]MDE0602147.1 histidine triad nucleotide-binding protein [bacterium]
MSSECLFCKIAGRSIPADVVAETDNALAFRDINPQAPTHVLVIPRQHVESLEEVDDPQMMGELVTLSRMIASREGLENGWRWVTNVGSDGGQSVFHLHFHLLGGRRMTWPPG